MPGGRVDTWMASRSDGETLLFGGKSGTTLLNDTWLLHMGRWQQMNPLASPAARSGFVMFYDPVSRGFILYGGLDSQNDLLSDTWAYAEP